MKRLTVTWREVGFYEVTIDVPDDYPEEVEAVEEQWSEQAGDWFTLVDKQKPDWPTQDLVEVNDRQLTSVRREA